MPDVLIVVDGDTGAGEVRAILRTSGKASQMRVVYIGSRHANLAYQRYLGWLAAVERGARYLVYFDDDLRLADPGILETLLTRLKINGLAGLTAETLTGSPDKFSDYEILREQREGKTDFFTRLTRSFGAARHLPPGALSPSGHRVPPSMLEKESEVSWLQGRVMVYDLNFLTRECFSEDLFALTSVKCGLGEDTFISYRVASKGSLRLLRGLKILHPDDDMPNSYPIRPYRFGFATAYSRRLLNDNYRFPKKSGRKDRAALLFSYAANTLAALLKAIRSLSWQRFAFFFGYSAGAFKGIFFPPRAATLCPGVDWFNDANKDLSGKEKLS